MQKGEFKGFAKNSHSTEISKQTATTTANNKKTPVRYAFLYCNSPVTQRQYPERLKIFFDSVGILPNGNLEEQGQAFLDQASLCYYPLG